MQTTTILAGALLGAALLFPAPPEAKPRPLAPISQVCADFGSFAYKRGVERDDGRRYGEALDRVMAWDNAQGVNLPIRQYHQSIVRVLYEFPTLTPEQHQRLVEKHCLEEIFGQATPVAQKNPRY